MRRESRGPTVRTGRGWVVAQTAEGSLTVQSQQGHPENGAPSQTLQTAAVSPIFSWRFCFFTESAWLLCHPKSRDRDKRQFNIISNLFLATIINGCSHIWSFVKGHSFPLIISACCSEVQRLERPATAEQMEVKATGLPPSKLIRYTIHLVHCALHMSVHQISKQQAPTSKANAPFDMTIGILARGEFAKLYYCEPKRLLSMVLESSQLQCPYLHLLPSRAFCCFVCILRSIKV